MAEFEVEEVTDGQTADNSGIFPTKLRKIKQYNNEKPDVSSIFRSKFMTFTL